ncbi:MAG: proline racemase family protein [Arhodomonas sp.]|nr:proline racemase family protein [Arhodomonas sp.]
MGRDTEYTVVDMHTAGEPVRIFTGGVPDLAGETLLQRRRDAMNRHDHVRRRLMLEPRGHADMYGVWPTRPGHPDAAMAVLFTHNEGYSTMCGHATIALGRYAVDRGIVPMGARGQSFLLECPRGPVAVRVAADAAGQPGPVSFDSVPAFASHLDASVEVPGYGPITVDVAYGGAFYVILPVSRLGMELTDAPYEDLLWLARRVTVAARSQLDVRTRTPRIWASSTAPSSPTIAPVARRTQPQRLHLRRWAGGPQPDGVRDHRPPGLGPRPGQRCAGRGANLPGDQWRGVPGHHPGDRQRRRRGGHGHWPEPLCRGIPLRRRGGGSPRRRLCGPGRALGSTQPLRASRGGT